jgi:hypothetical protein
LRLLGEFSTKTMTSVSYTEYSDETTLNTTKSGKVSREANEKLEYISLVEAGEALGASKAAVS